MKITIAIAVLIGVWSLAARCNSDALVENPKTASTETIVADGGNGASAIADSPATVDKNPAVVVTPEPAPTASSNTVDEADFDPDDPEDAAIAAEVREIMSHNREVFRQEMHDYGPNAVPYLMHLFGVHKGEVAGDAALCLGAIGDERAVEPIIERIKEILRIGGSVSYFVQALGYLAAQGSERAYQYLLRLVQSATWEKNNKDGLLKGALWALVKSNRDDAYFAVIKLHAPLKEKALAGKELTPLEKQLLNEVPAYEKAREQIKRVGIFGIYNSEIRAKAGFIESERAESL